MADPTDHLTAVRAALDLAAKATPGPWRYADDDPTHPIMAGRHVEVACGSTPRDLGGDPAIEWNRDADPLAIAAMHNAAPGLRAALDELERLRAHVDAAGDGLNLAALLDLYRDREQAAVAEVERLRADARRHADARAALFTAYLRAGGDPTIRAALRTFFAATEEP